MSFVAKLFSIIPLAPFSLAHQTTAMQLSLEQRKLETNRITWWGVLVNLILSVIKIVGGMVGQSQALLADGLHSLSDLASDGMVLLAAKHAGEDADEDHPYGHARYETLATVALGFLLMGVAVGIGVDAINRLNQDVPPLIPHLYTLVIAAVSVLSKELLYHATKRVALLIKSPMLEANAWHHRSDAISSIIVFIGIGGTFLGYPLLDVVAALLVAFMIAKIGVDLARQSVQELVDTALDPETTERIKQTILAIDDVRQLHMLRSRRMGHHALIDVHIQVSPRLSVSEGHHISEMVENKLKQNFDEINDVVVHIDPEDDEQAASCSHLPLRSELLMALHHEWQAVEAFTHIHDVTLHYLNGSVSVEAILPISSMNTLDEAAVMQQRFKQVCQEIACIGDCFLNFR